MLSGLRALLGAGTQNTAPTSTPVAPQPGAGDVLVDLYPPNDGTIPVLDPDRLIQHHRKVVEDIFQASGLEKRHAEPLLGRSILAFASRAVTLPATRDEFYAGKGGLLRLGLDTALASARKAQVAEFTGLGKIEQRRRETSAWRVACILAALCYDIHRVSSLFAVTSPDGAAWAPLRQSLWDFARERGAGHVLIAWRDRGPSHSGIQGQQTQLTVNAALVSQIVPHDAMQYMYDGDPDILTQFYAVISGEAHSQPANRVRPIVEDMRARVLAADAASDPRRFGSKGIGTSLGPYFADGLRQLRVEGRWTVNDDRGRVWVGREGVFLIWPVAAKEIQEWLQGAKLPGIPRDERTIAEMLRDSQIIAPRTSGRDVASVLWRIRLPAGREVSALKLASQTILFPDGDSPPPADIALLTMAEEGAPRIDTGPRPGADSTTAPISLPVPSPATASQSPPPAPVPTQIPADAGLTAAIKALDPAGQAFARSLVRTIGSKSKRPKGVKLRDDGSLVITCALLGEFGMGIEPLARKLFAAGWLAGTSRDFIRKIEGEDVVVFEPPIARLLLGDQAEPDLLTGAAES